MDFHQFCPETFILILKTYIVKQKNVRFEVKTNNLKSETYDLKS